MTTSSSNTALNASKETSILFMEEQSIALPSLRRDNSIIRDGFGQSSLLLLSKSMLGIFNDTEMLVNRISHHIYDTVIDGIDEIEYQWKQLSKKQF